MKEIVVISGKGGTGKTSLLASFACLASHPVLADCDVDAADLYLVLEPNILRQEDFSGGNMARIISEKCTNCGICMDVCRFDAVKKEISKDKLSSIEYSIDEVACEGCGVCAYFCPEKAIDFSPAINGKWFVSETRVGPMVHARLGIAEENSGKLVTLVRNQAKKIAEENGHPYLLVDGPPGIGCPVIASITGSDLVVIVTEPTVSGEHDLDRVHELANHFGIPAVVCINKYDINPEVTKRITDRSEACGMRIVGKIRYDKAFTKAQIVKSSVIEYYTQSPVADDIRETWSRILDAL
ncbi:MAG: ATP-binding protein [Thermodesulfobacteriota bacterium]|nr:ATP-binding protein [Thermodesulfobacteriota bacterium]